MSKTRALVLAGGGAAGNAWELGLVAGLAEGGVDVTDADLIIGTSAGSTVAAQITSRMHPAELYAAILAETPPPPGRGRPAVSGPSYMDWSDGIIASAADPGDMRRRLGAAAIEKAAADAAAQDASQPSPGARWRAVVASRLPSPEWPPGRVLIAAVDAQTGEPVVFDRESEVELVDAVAASTSAMTPYPIGDRLYMNGGYRRSENADLAAGCDRVLVLSPFSGATRMPLEWRMDLASQVEDLRATGSQVVTVFPDSGAGEVFDANALDPSTRLPAARGGYAQGRALAEELAGFWN